MSIKLLFQKAAWVIKHIQELRDYSARNFYENKDGEPYIRNSVFFDEDYYKRNNPDIPDNEDPAEHYYRIGGFERRDPSEFFSSEEYYYLNPDIKRLKSNPLYNFEEFGRGNNLLFSTLQLPKEDHFPPEAQNISRVREKNPVIHKRTAVVSCFLSGGNIPESLLIMLRGLEKVADNIILVGDCPVIPAELDKLSGLVCYAEFERHKQYDFGSYKRGLQYARITGLLDDHTSDELILLNDSCWGPVYPFEELWQRMENEICDFWGCSGLKDKQQLIHKSHISSYFYVFRKPVISSRHLDNFLNNIQGEYDRNKVILTLETQLTDYLQKKGFLWQTVYKECFNNIYDKPLTFLKEYRIPLVKKKAFKGLSKEDLTSVLSVIRENNPELAEYIHIPNKETREFKPPSIREHQDSFEEKIKEIKNRRENGERVKAVFLTASATSFPAESLFRKMLADPFFEPKIAVIPDLQDQKKILMDIVIEIAEQERALISAGIPEEQLIRVRPDDMENWPDVCEKADIVCYSSARNISSFRYQPKYAAGRDFLPILVCDDDPDEQNEINILRLDANRYMWKIFFTNEKTCSLYREISPDGGLNAEITGNMDKALNIIRQSLDDPEK